MKDEGFGFEGLVKDTDKGSNLKDEDTYDKNHVYSELPIRDAKALRLDKKESFFYQAEQSLVIWFYSIEIGHAYYSFHTLNQTYCLLLQGKSTGSGQLIFHMTNIMFNSE